MIKMKPCEYHKIFSSIQPDTVKMSSEVPTTEMDALDEYITEQSDVMEKVYVNDKPFIHFKNGLVYGQDIYVCDMRNNLRSLVESSIVVRQKKYKLPEYLKKVGYDYGTKIPDPTTESTNKNIDYKTVSSSSPDFKKYLEKYNLFKDPDKVSKEYNGDILIDPSENALIGRVLIGNKKDKGFITDLVVDKKYRGLGFGNMLLDSAINKYNGVDLTVKKNNSIAIDMYKKRGFVVDDSLNAGKDMHYMRLKSHNKSIREAVEATTIEEPITEAKSVKLGRQKFKPMSIKQLQHAADRLMKSQDANVVRYGQTLKESADEGFSDVMKYLSNVNLILFIGGESLATCMPYIVSSILIIKQDNPEMMVIPELKKQRSIIKSKLKPKDDNLRLYTEFITQVINDDLKYTRESVEIPEEFYPLFESDDMDDDDEDEDYDDKEDEKYDDDKDDPDDEDRDHDDDDDDNIDDIHDDDNDRESVTEAKKKDDEEEDPENTDDEDGDTPEEPEEEPQEEEPEEDEPYNEDFGDEGPTDYTEEVEDDEPEPDEEEPEKEGNPKPLRKIRYNEDFGKNGPKDYTEDIEDDEDEPTEEEPETPEEPEEEPPTDETPEEDNTQEDNEIPEEEPQGEEPDTYNEDFGEDGPTDYTADEDVDEPEEEPQDTTPEEPNTTEDNQTQDTTTDQQTETPPTEDTTQPDNTNQDVDTTQNTDTTENQPQEDNNLDNNEEPQQDDNGLEDGPTDYDAEAGVDTGDTDTTTDDGGDTTGDTNEEGGDAGADTTADPNGETPTDDSNGNDRDIAVKNYNIRLKFKKLVESISEILQNLSIVVYHNPIQNQVLERGIENIQSIKEQIISYMEFNLSSDYKTNLYYYTTFIQALQLNLDMLTKNSQMSMEDTKNNK